MSLGAADSFDPKIWLVIAGAAALAVVPGLLSGRKTFFSGLGDKVSFKKGKTQWDLFQDGKNTIVIDSGTRIYNATRYAHNGKIAYDTAPPVHVQRRVVAMFNR